MCLCRREDARAVRVDKEGWSILCVFKEQIEEEQQNVYVFAYRKSSENFTYEYICACVTIALNANQWLIKTNTH